MRRQGRVVENGVGPRLPAADPSGHRISDIPDPVDDGPGGAAVLHERAADGRSSGDVRQPQQVCAAGRALLHLRRRPDDARRNVGAAVALGELDDRQRARQPAAHLARLCGGVRRDLGGHDRDGSGGRLADVSAHAQGRLQRALRVRADHGGRRHRQSDPALDRHDHLRHRIRYLGRRAVRGRDRTRASAGGAVRHLHLPGMRPASTCARPRGSRWRSSWPRASTASGRSARSS